MGWIVAIIIALIILGLSDAVTSQFWIMLLIVIACVVVLCVLIRKRKQKKIIQSPEFQTLLHKAQQVKAICQRMPDSIGAPLIDEYDVLPYTPIDTHERQTKKRVSLEEARKSYACKVFFQVVIKDDCSMIRRTIQNYLECHREIYKGDHFRAGRDAYGERLLQSLFASKADAEAFMKLTGYEVVDIVFDCIDLDPDSKDYLIFHFELYCLEFSGDKNKMNLFLKELKSLEKSRGKKKHSRNSWQLQPVKIPTYGQGNVQVYQCTCGTKFRVPTDKGKIVATCPNTRCRKKWYL